MTFSEYSCPITLSDIRILLHFLPSVQLGQFGQSGHTSLELRFGRISRTSYEAKFEEAANAQRKGIREIFSELLTVSCTLISNILTVRGKLTKDSPLTLTPVL